jgi:hypothetical protein
MTIAAVEWERERKRPPLTHLVRLKAARVRATRQGQRPGGPRTRASGSESTAWVDSLPGAVDRILGTCEEGCPYPDENKREEGNGRLISPSSHRAWVAPQPAQAAPMTRASPTETSTA